MKTFIERNQYRVCLKIIGIILSGLAVANVIHGQEFTYTGSVQGVNGDYIFTEQAFNLYLFSGFEVTKGPVRLTTNVPVIIQSTPWISYGGAGILPTGGGQHAEVDRRNNGDAVELSEISESNDIGLGDPISRLDVEIVKESGALPSVHLLTEVKFPVADFDRGSGTGEWDYGGGFSISKTVQNRFYSLELLYLFLGDLPDLELENPVSFNFAVGQPLADGAFDILVSISGYSRIIRAAEHPAQFGIDFIRQLDSGKSITFGAAFGLTEASPDVLLSLGWSVGI